MMNRKTIARWWPVAALGVVIAVSAAHSIWWVFNVPIYQSPDEPAHLDYAFGIHANKGLLPARYREFRQLPPDSHPYTEYLRGRVHHPEVAFRPHMKMPADYGTREFFASIDRDAPPVDKVRTCQLASVYPFGYYSLVAIWIDVVQRFRDGLVATVFGARLFSVLLLAISLTLTYATMRLLNIRPAFALLVTACIGIFPLTSFVSSYVQPDNLSFTFVSLSFYLSLRARTKGFTAGSLLLLGGSLGGLLITKMHFWICVTPAVLAMIAAEIATRKAALSRRRLAGGALCLVTPSLLLGGLYVWSVWGTTNYFAPPHQGNRLVNVVRLSRLAVEDFFAGTTHLSFWGVFGWLDTPLKFRSTRLNEVAWVLIQTATWVLLGLTLLRLEQITSRLYKVVRGGRPATALRIACSNPVINSYFVFTAFMFTFFIWTSNRFGGQGRNWFPFMLPIFLVGLVYAPKSLSLPSARKIVSASLTIGLVAFCVLGSHAARSTIRERYYVNNAETPVEIPVPLQPSEYHDMTWTVAAGEAYGNDSHVVYELEQPTFVQGVRLRFVVSNPDNEPAHFQAYWRNGVEAFTDLARTVHYDVEPWRERTVVFPVNAEITHLRLDPDIKPSAFEIREITLFRPPTEAERANRRAKK